MKKPLRNGAAFSAEPSERGEVGAFFPPAYLISAQMFDPSSHF